MPKALCIFGMSVSALILLIFLLDMAIAFPFNGAHMGMDIGFILASLIVGALSWITMREQV